MIVVTGATGQLGRLVVQDLLTRVPADQVVAAVRSPEKATDLAERGVHVREADYDRPDTLKAAFKGADKVLLISGSDVGRRVPQHQAVIDAAKEAGVSLLAYTSVLHADTSTVAVAPEHKATEEAIKAGGLTYSLLRNGWYNENYVPTARQGAATGTVIGSARDGRVAAASRADYAAAAAVVLTEDGHADTVYELSGDTAWTMDDLAADISAVAGTPVVYQDLPAEAHAKALTEAGLPEPVVGMLVSIDASIAAGWLADTTGDLSRLIGRPTTPLRTTLAAALVN
ncbi:SDR family oxidoreductase [Saccharothrix sp. 6-C]|uniref:SDR family oxidoreductase n=1 Tax=Saccharothrix sp. 6-C TaxID=2781735 RepID=UPI001917435A|nr:SDR family oxidoreductase [Saccharothrix sp. 6-C]QQQ80214.1 SDR family oxidoreductase [Saccharothrix sp. 6-C]